MKKRLMALLLVLTMVVTMLPVSVFAADAADAIDTVITKTDKNYVSLGDSMTNGYGLTGYEPDGLGGTNGYLQVAPESYPAQFAAWLAGYDGTIENGQTKYIGENGVVNLTQLAMSGMRAEDALFALSYDWENWEPGNMTRAEFDAMGIGDYHTWDEFVNSKFVYNYGAWGVYNLSYYCTVCEKTYKGTYSGGKLLAESKWDVCVHVTAHDNAVSDADNVQWFGGFGAYSTVYAEQYPEAAKCKYVIPYCVESTADGSEVKANQFGNAWFGNGNAASAAQYQNAIKNADVISICLGNANFGVVMLSRLLSANGVLPGFGAADYCGACYNKNCGNHTADGHWVFDISNYRYEDLKATITDPAILEVAVAAENLILDYMGIDGCEETKEYATANLILYTTVSYALSYRAMLDRIAELNPDAEIIIVGNMNAMSGIKMVMADGDVLDLQESMENIFGLLNDYLAGLATLLNETDSDHKDITYYYAEEPTVDVLVNHFADEIDGDNVLRDRFISEITGRIFDMMGGAMPSMPGGIELTSNITREQVEAYMAENYDGLSAAEHFSCAAYTAFERAIMDGSEAGILYESAFEETANGFDGVFGPIADALANNLVDSDKVMADVTAEITAWVAENYASYSSMINAYGAEATFAIMNGLVAAENANVDTVTAAITNYATEKYATAQILANIEGALYDAMMESDNLVFPTLLSMFGRMIVGTGVGQHPSAEGHNALFAAVKNSYENKYTVQDETMKNAMEALEIAKELVLEYYDEAYAYGYAYAADNGYITMAQKGIADAIAAIEAIDLDATDMTEEFKVQLQAELDALVVTLEKLNAALAAGQFATVDSLVATCMALENDLYVHLDNIKYISQQAGSDVYELVVLPAIDYINTVTIPNAKLAVQAVLDQAWQYISAKIYEAYGIVIDINTSVTDMIDMVQTCIAKKIAEAMGIVVDVNATVQDIINAIREHIAHITAGEVEITEDFFYLAIVDGDEGYADLVAEALKLGQAQYMEVTLDEVTPELLAQADFITVGYNGMSAVEFAKNQILGAANIYVQYVDAFVKAVDAKFDATYPGMANQGIDLYTMAMAAVQAEAGEYLALLEGKEVTALDWAALVGAENLPYVEEARAQMQAAVIEAGVPETYSIAFDVVSAVVEMTKDYAPLDENALRTALGEHAVFSLDIPVAELAVFAAESALHEYISYNKEYANTMVAINAINPEATVAALGNYNRFNVDYTFVTEEICFIPAEVLAQFGFEGFALPTEAKDALAAVAALGVYELDIPTTEAVQSLLAKYNELVSFAVSFELPVNEETALLIADLIETANACVEHAAGQIEDVYTVTIPVTDLMNMAAEQGRKIDALINASLNTEVVIASQTIQVSDVLDLIANLSSIHPFAYASAFSNAFYVDIADANLGGSDYIAEQILNALTVTCAHADNDMDHYCDLYCGEKLTECADEDADHYCDVCGAELSKCADENTDHYCDVCGICLSQCSDAQNDGDHNCDYCGKADVTAHRYSSATCISPSRCAECGAIGSTAAHTEQIIPAVDATCTATGLTEGKKCSVCGEILVAQKEVAALGHTEEIIPAVEATCGAIGLTEGIKCAVCEEILVAQEEIPALEHKYESVVTAPNCIDGGYTTHTCSLCGDTFVDSYTAARAHKFDVVTVVVEPTCTTLGSRRVDCAYDDCDSFYYANNVIPTIAHTEEIIPGKAATCTETGLTDGSKCAVCGEILVAQEEIPAAGHSFGDWTVSKEATRKEAGEETRSCACGETETREIPALGGANVGVIVGCGVGGVGILAVIVIFLLKKKKLF